MPASYLCYMPVGNATSCHAGCQEDSRCRTRGESQEFIACRPQNTQVRDPPWLWNPGKHHQKSKTGVSVAPQKGLLSSKNLKKKHIVKMVSKHCIRKTHSSTSEHQSPGDECVIRNSSCQAVFIQGTRKSSCVNARGIPPTV